MAREMARPWLLRLRALETGSSLSRACGMFLAEMPLPQDSLNQMLEIPELLASEYLKRNTWKYVKSRETSFFIFSNPPPPSL